MYLFDVNISDPYFEFWNFYLMQMATIPVFLQLIVNIS